MQPAEGSALPVRLDALYTEWLQEVWDVNEKVPEALRPSQAARTSARNG